MTSERTVQSPLDPSTMQVVGAPRRSLFDAVRPGEVQRRGSQIRGPGRMVLAALRHPGVTGGEITPADAVVLGGRAFGAAPGGWIPAREAEAIGLACGVAATRSRRTAGGRTWVLLRAQALTGGLALESAAQVPRLPPARLVVLVVGDAREAPRTSGILQAMGYPVRQADNDDAWSVLSALDHAGRDAEDGPAAVVATRTEA